MIVGIEMDFDAAHYLPNYEGKCKRLHGHTWHVKVEVIGNIQDNSGMVIDFGILKNELKEVLARFDHYRLNDTIANPTCEYVVTHIKAELLAKHINVLSVEVREGEGGWARI